VTEPGQRLRHSPGKTQRKIMRGTNEMKYSSNCGARHMPCLLPCTNGLHALCQRGAFTEMLTVWMARSMFEEEGSADKSRAISRLHGISFGVADGNTSRSKPYEGVLGSNPVSNREV
jgi:hypothetical protein